MVLSDEETGIDRKDLTVRVQRYAVSSLHVTVLVKIGDELILEVPNGNEGSRIVWDFVLCVNGTLEYTPVLVDGVLRERGYRNPL
jgi:hypothetical protein